MWFYPVHVAVSFCRCTQFGIPSSDVDEAWMRLQAELSRSSRDKWTTGLDTEILRQPSIFALANFTRKMTIRESWTPKKLVSLVSCFSKRTRSFKSHVMHSENEAKDIAELSRGLWRPAFKIHLQAHYFPPTPSF